MKTEEEVTRLLEVLKQQLASYDNRNDELAERQKLSLQAKIEMLEWVLEI